MKVTVLWNHNKVTFDNPFWKFSNTLNIVTTLIFFSLIFAKIFLLHSALFTVVPVRFTKWSKRSMFVIRRVTCFVLQKYHTLFLFFHILLYSSCDAKNFQPWSLKSIFDVFEFPFSRTKHQQHQHNNHLLLEISFLSATSVGFGSVFWVRTP